VQQDHEGQYEVNDEAPAAPFFRARAVTNHVDIPPEGQ
jgi:hypothetical protein